jgi:hypothetical protein
MDELILQKEPTIILNRLIFCLFRITSAKIKSEMTKKDAALETRNKYNQRGGSRREMNTKVNPLPPYHPTPSADENTAAAAALPFLQVQTEEYIHSAGQRTFIYLETRPLVYWIITEKKEIYKSRCFVATNKVVCV